MPITTACRSFAPLLAIIACTSGQKARAPMAITLTSSAFAANGEIPRQYTCQGANTSPPLSWTGVPDRTRALALVVDDPDAPDPAHPRITWVHWVVYDLPPHLQGLPEGAGKQPGAAGGHDGLNGWKQPLWNGPCPPIGRHRYFFKLFALDAPLGDRGALTSDQLQQAMNGHILARGELVGAYQKTP